MLYLFTVYIASSYMCEFCVYVTKRLASAVMLLVTILGVLGMFNGGTVINFDEQGFWVWIDHISLLSWASRGMLIASHLNIDYGIL